MSKFTFLSSDDLARQIKMVGNRITLTTLAIQKLAVNAIYQSIEHGNTVPATSLYNALGKSMRRDSLVKFLEVYGNLVWNKDKKAFDHNKCFTVFDEAQGETLMGEPWENAKKEPEVVSQFDVVEAADKFIKRTKDASKKAGTVIHEDLLTLLAETVQKYNARLILGESAVEKAE